MRKILKDSGHLVRLALAFALGIAIFFLIRRAIVPASFGQYGHYRGAVLDEIRAKPVKYAGRELCEACHEPVATAKNLGKHAQVGCEACHGALAAHTEDPSGVKPVMPNVATLCVRCHEADSAKPRNFPQVNSKEHAGEASCTVCHDPHHPKPGS
jgi:hypothetical protein